MLTKAHLFQKIPFVPLAGAYLSSPSPGCENLPPKKIHYWHGIVCKE
jgi:hypothetical protein